MATHQDRNVSFNPDEQLSRLRSWCRDSAPAFYADQADYLRRLRHHLPQVVHTALGELLCGIDRDRLIEVSEQSRHELQGRIDQLVKRCSSLLTIEQLQLLARDLAQEEQIQRRQLKQSMVDSLQRHSDAVEGARPRRGPERAGSGSDAGDGAGSVSLSLSPPIDQPELLEGLLPSHGQPDDDPAEEDASLGSDVLFDEPSTGTDPSGLDGDSSHGSTDLALLRSLFVMAGQAMEAEDQASLRNVADAEEPSSSQSDNASEFMPSMPLELQRWLEGLDWAVKRRLRNLSHAINVELLRAGLASSLLPMSLLDAVLSGQVETLPSASNLLRLRVPLPTTAQGGEDLIDLNCVLLRTADLEFDLVSLRRCRSRLRQRKRSLLTMVRQQRHWQRRAQTQQVQKQWWQSPPNSSPQT